MAAPQICLGCFSEWDEKQSVCPVCGWEPDKSYTDMLDWTTGDVLEKRYLLGKLVLRWKDTALWRIYDNLLGISCFVLRNVQDRTKELVSLAAKLKNSGREFKILAVKTIAAKNVLLFSFNDYSTGAEVFEAVLKEQDAVLPSADIEEEYKKETPQKESALQPKTKLSDRYRIIRCIGIGGFGITYLCEDLILRRLVAVKEYFPSQWAERDGEYVTVKQSSMVEAYRFGIQSFLKEARITAKFIHSSCLVTIYDILYANDTIYLVMNYISGISIGREMRGRNYKPYTPEETAEIILPVLKALEKLHEKSIVHSDISPGNIMRADTGEIYLIDMGASKYSLESQPVLSAAFLKPDYAAPEQYQTAREGIPKNEGPWTDIYAVGATMYYLMTGHRATDALSRLNGVNANLVPPKKYKVKLSKQWMELIRHAMALKAGERINSAAVFQQEIQKLLK